jgi:DNA invertase Pin-like site-specific DNA recombinase
VLGYVRVSTDDQADSGLGLAAQRRAIRAEAERRGWELVDVIVDSGVSGKTDFGARPGGAEVLERIEAGEATAVVAAKLDRLSRSVTAFGQLVERALANSWRLVALDCDVDMTTASGELVANIMASVAQWERRVIGERTKAALAAKRAQGVKLGRPRLQDPAVATRIRERRSEGMTLQAIADELNDAGTTTPTGRRWSPVLVRKVALQTV